MDAAELAEHVERIRAEGHESWGYHARASVEHGYVCMTIPKVACTTVKMALRVGEIAFQDAVSCLLENPTIFDDHWSRQVDVLVSDVIDYDVIGRFESFNQDFQAVLRRLDAPVEVMETARRVFNATAPVSLDSVYDPGLAKRVYDHYYADFDAFGYREDSWHIE